jgi:hypothetical protein
MFKVNGKEYEAEKVQSAIDALEMLLGDAQGKVTELTASVATKDAELATAKSKETVDALVTAELVKREEAQKAEVRKAAVQKAYPKMVLDGKTVETIDALFETIKVEDAEIVALAPGAAGGEASAERVETADEKPARIDPRAKMLADNRKLAAGRAPEGE